MRIIRNTKPLPQKQYPHNLLNKYPPQPTQPNPNPTQPNPTHHTFNTHINNMDTQNPLRSPQKIPSHKKKKEKSTNPLKLC